MNWTDARDGLRWEIEAIPVQPQMGDGERFPIIGETSYTVVGPAWAMTWR